MFECKITPDTSCPCVAVQGRIDALSAPQLQKIFSKLILEGTRTLLADLTGVNYISSAGLRIFIIAQKELKKVGGEILLSGLKPQVSEVFKVSGLHTQIRIIKDKDDIRELLSPGEEKAAVRRIINGDISLEITRKDVLPGSFFLIGSAAKMDTAAYTENDVVTVSVSGMRAGCGLAALGDEFEEYKNLFGEAVVINGNFFYYPAVRHSSVDFLLNSHSDSFATFKFLHGFGFNGDYRYLVSFKGEKGPLDMATFINSFFTVSNANLIGITFLAESRGIWGMNIKQPPVSGRQPENRGSIFSNSSFSEWFDFPVEPSQSGAVVAAAGIAVRDLRKLPAEMQKLFSGSKTFHLHGGIFSKAPLSYNLEDFDRELSRVFEELEVLKIQHLLGQSLFAGGMAAIVELEV